MSDHWTISAEAVAGLLSLVDRREVGCGIAIGTDDTIVDVIRCPNFGAVKFAYAGRGLQTAWAYSPEDEAKVDRIAASVGCRTLGFVHTHRHGKTLPSLSDWRRQRYAHAFGAVFHPGSGLVTFSRRGTPKRPSEITYRARLHMPDGLLEKIRTFCATPIDSGAARSLSAPDPIIVPVQDKIVPARLVRELYRKEAA